MKWDCLSGYFFCLSAAWFLVTDVPLASCCLTLVLLLQDDRIFFLGHEILHHEFCGCEHVAASAHKLLMNAACNFSHLIMREVKKIQPPNLKLYMTWICSETVLSKIYFLSWGPESTLFKAFYHSMSLFIIVEERYAFSSKIQSRWIYLKLVYLVCCVPAWILEDHFPASPECLTLSINNVFCDHNVQKTGSAMLTFLWAW